MLGCERFALRTGFVVSSFHDVLVASFSSTIEIRSENTSFLLYFLKKRTLSFVGLLGRAHWRSITGSGIVSGGVPGPPRDGSLSPIH